MDLIDRQSVLKAIDEYERLSAVSQTVRNMTSLREIVQQLPSVQPKRTETHACDCISRQAVIAEFSCCELTPDGGIDANYAIDFLEQLPPAQPPDAEIQKMQDLEQSEIQKAYELGKLDAMEELIRCKDCKYFTRNIPCVGGHYNGCNAWTDNGNEIMVAEDDFCSYAERRTDSNGRD